MVKFILVYDRTKWSAEAGLFDRKVRVQALVLEVSISGLIK